MEDGFRAEEEAQKPRDGRAHIGPELSTVERWSWRHKRCLGIWPQNVEHREQFGMVPTFHICWKCRLSHSERQE